MSAITSTPIGAESRATRTTGRLLFLDLSGGRVLSANPGGSDLNTIINEGRKRPDGLVLDVAAGHIYWANMGDPNRNDGSIMRSDLDGNNVITIVSPGKTFTPKQLKLEKTSGKLYWSDREGMRVMRANLHGSEIETLIDTSQGDSRPGPDARKWCVGIAVDTDGGKFYWTQQGGQHAGLGRIFRANIRVQRDQSAENRSDIELLFDNLPEPIDLDLDPSSRTLYWTDRGVPPRDNTVSRAPLDRKSGNGEEPEILFTHLKEGIGLALDLSRTGSFLWRVSTNEFTWSKELYRIYELDPGVPVTLELIRSRTHPDDLPSFYDIIERVTSGAHHYEYERRLKMPDETIKYIHVVAHLTRDREGRLAYIGALQDVTERRLSELALDKARSELARMARVTSLGALTASIAHEINQPLLGIVTNASTCLQMLAAEPPNIEGAQEAAQFLRMDGRRASDVIMRLRSLFSKSNPTMELLDLSEATQEVVTLSLNELQRNRVILRTAYAHELPPVHGDRVQLQQVILNLLMNASEAMRGVDDRPRQLLIRTGLDEDDNVRLTVQDAGVGLEQGDVERVFESFYSTKSDGIGIGLSISRSILERHRGRIWAAPNPGGPGATFSFAIPRAVEDVTTAPEPDVLQPRAAGVTGAFAGDV